MTKSILIVGKSSVLGKAFSAKNADLSIRQVGHNQIDQAGLFEGVDVVVNFAFAPDFFVQPYSDACDIDLRIAEHAARYSTHYIMVSSRKVYAPEAQWDACEDSPVIGIDHYGRNKLRIEEKLIQKLGDKLTILRPGNVIGFERMVGRQRFGSFLLNQLAETGKIELSISPHVRRDIVPMNYFCSVLREFTQKKLSGVFNLGAGEACSVGDVAGWIIAGYGKGAVHARSTAVIDEFQLNSSKLVEATGIHCGRALVESYCRMLGGGLSKDVMSR